VLAADFGYYPVDASTCDSWIYKNSLTHPVLRDKGGAGSIAALLGLQVKDMLLVDRQLKIVFKGHVSSSFDQGQVLSALNNLP
jgi:hypothetical protein